MTKTPCIYSEHLDFVMPQICISRGFTDYAIVCIEWETFQTPDEIIQTGFVNGGTMYCSIS